MCLRLPGLIVLGGGTACGSIRSAMSPGGRLLPRYLLVISRYPRMRAPLSRLPYCRWLPVDAIGPVCSLRYRRPGAAPVAAGVAGQVG
jgi:hypothetical protein